MFLVLKTIALALAIVSATAWAEESQEFENLKKEVKALKKGQNLDSLGSKGELHESAVLLISLFNSAKDSDELIESIKKTSLKEKLTLIAYNKKQPRLQIIQIELSETYSFDIYFDTQSKELLNYGVHIEFDF